jgi:hypothetical protein
MVAAAGSPAHTAGQEKARFKRLLVPQYIAALGDPGASAGNGAEAWGVWRVDPGPRGVRLDRYERLKAAGAVAPAGWKFDSTDWWLEEHGLIMEKPDFPLPPGKYLVTGDRDVMTILTVHPRDKNGNHRWELGDGATLHDVTHLACRSARYTPPSSNRNACSPASAKQAAFPVAPGATMPSVDGCSKQDYAVLIIVGVP